jgi:hypothetical protein
MSFPSAANIKKRINLHGVAKSSTPAIDQFFQNLSPFLESSLAELNAPFSIAANR